MFLDPFLPITGDSKLEEVATVISSCPYNAVTGLLMASGFVKTTFLFQYAYNVASKNKLVVYIQEKTRTNSFFPRFPIDFSPSDDILAKIEMRHLSSAKQLQSYLSNIHLLPQLPQLIVIDDFSSFFPGIPDKPEMFKTLAFIKEAADYASSAVCESGECNECSILIGEVLETESVQKKLDLFEPWIPLVFLIQGQHDLFTLTVQIQKSQDPHHTIAVFQFNKTNYMLCSLETDNDMDHLQAQNTTQHINMDDYT